MPYAYGLCAGSAFRLTQDEGKAGCKLVTLVDGNQTDVKLQSTDCA